MSKNVFTFVLQFVIKDIKSIDMGIKSILKREFKERLLSSEQLIGMLADKLRVQSQTIRKGLSEDRQVLLLPHGIIAIREVLGLAPDAEIIEVLEEETHLHE